MGMENVQGISGAEVQRMIAAGTIGIAIGVYGEGDKPTGSAVPTAETARQIVRQVNEAKVAKERAEREKAIAKLAAEEKARAAKAIYDAIDKKLMGGILTAANGGKTIHAAIVPDAMLDKFLPALDKAGYRVVCQPPNCSGCRAITDRELRDRMCAAIREANERTDTLVVVNW